MVDLNFIITGDDKIVLIIFQGDRGWKEWAEALDTC